jgi:UDP-N-acetylglucosamine acyltransferase
MQVHPTAHVDPKAELGPEVVIGPEACVGPKVKIGARTQIGFGAVVTGNTTIGADNKIHPYAVIGGDPQDLKYGGERTRLEIGDRNVFREYVTANVGTEKDHGVTRIGSNNFIMAYCHVAHDCALGDHIVMANAANLGGHVHIEDRAIISGLVGVHHFVTIGRLAFVGGMSRIGKDVPPFMIVEGNPSRVRVVNVVGLKRNGFSAERIEALKTALRLLYRSDVNSADAFRRLEEAGPTEDVAYLIQFLRRVEAGRQGRALEAFRKTSIT